MYLKRRYRIENFVNSPNKYKLAYIQHYKTQQNLIEILDPKKKNKRN